MMVAFPFDPLPPELAMTLYGAGFLGADHVRRAADGDLLAVPGIGRFKLIQIRQALGQDTAHLVPRPKSVRALRVTDKMIALVEAYQRCTPAHQDMLVHLAEILAGNRAIKKAADKLTTST